MRLARCRDYALAKRAISIIRAGTERDWHPGMAGKGHEDPFPPPELSVCYVFRQETFAGTHGNGQDAPTADHIPGY
jgi:hypothetical protein